MIGTAVLIELLENSGLYEYLTRDVNTGIIKCILNSI